MTPIIIALLILAIGAAVLIVAGIFTAKLLQKRKEGLDWRQDAITRREGKLDSREIQLDRLKADIAERMGWSKIIPEAMKPVNIGCTLSIDPIPEEDKHWKVLYEKKLRLLELIAKEIAGCVVFSTNECGEGITLTAELWVLRKEADT